MATTSPHEPERPALCPTCGSERTPIVGQSGNPAVGDLLAFLHQKSNHQMFSLYRTRQLLTDVQQRIGADAIQLGRVGEALASVRESERVLADIQHRIESLGTLEGL